MVSKRVGGNEDIPEPGFYFVLQILRPTTLSIPCWPAEFQDSQNFDHKTRASDRGEKTPVLQWRHPHHRRLAMLTPYQRSNDKTLKPRALKRMRQQESMLAHARRPAQFPLPQPPLWKPLG